MSTFETVFTNTDFSVDKHFKTAMQILNSLHSVFTTGTTQPWRGALNAHDRVSGTGALIAINSGKKNLLPWQMILATMCEEAIRALVAQRKLSDWKEGKDYLTNLTKIQVQLDKDSSEKTALLFDSIATIALERYNKISRQLAHVK